MNMYNKHMGNRVIHISDVEAASDFASLLNRVRSGTEFVIEHEHRPVAVVRASEPGLRTISECIALAKAHENDSGQAPVLDPDFAADVHDVINNRRPWNPPPWE